MNCIKKFSRIVCVSLFSYQGSLFAVSQTARLLYHKFSRLSTVNLNFLKTNFFFSISEAIPCDSLFILPLLQGGVKHFLQKTSIFFLQNTYQLHLPTGKRCFLPKIRQSNECYTGACLKNHSHNLYDTLCRQPFSNKL